MLDFPWQYEYSGVNRYIHVKSLIDFHLCMYVTYSMGDSTLVDLHNYFKPISKRNQMCAFNLHIIVLLLVLIYLDTRFSRILYVYDIYRL